MTHANHHHIMIGNDTWCDWSSCQAGADINQKAGDVKCGHTTAAAAQSAAKALRPHFKHGRVKVVQGPCPQDLVDQKNRQDMARVRQGSPA